VSRALFASLLVLSLAVGVRDTLASGHAAVGSVITDASGEAVAKLNEPGLL